MLIKIGINKIETSRNAKVIIRYAKRMKKMNYKINKTIFISKIKINLKKMKKKKKKMRKKKKTVYN